MTAAARSAVRPSDSSKVSMRPLRPWDRLSLRMAVVFALVTVLAVGLVGGVIYQRQKREVEDTVGTQLLNIARVAALMVDPALHSEVQRTRRQDSDAYQRIRKTLATIQNAAVLTTPIYTLTDYDAPARQARFMVTSRGPGAPGEPYPLVPEVAEPLGWSFEDGVARYTRAYRNQSGTWISAFGPIVDGTGRTIAVLDVDYAIDVYLDRLRELERSVVLASLAGGLGALICGLLFARYLTRPISALTAGVARVAAGDLSQALPVRSRDEIGRLTQAFNQMLEGLRQRDFIRNAFGRYVSPEVAKALLESPDGLRLGGEKREVSVLMSDLRGYTQFAERGDPAWVMDVLNGYLARMAEVVIAHGGTVNEFIGDAVFAIFGAPIAHADHAERAAAAALTMQAAMVEINAAHVARGLPRFEMGIGINTGEAVVGNIGSEQRAKYTVVGNAVNVAARVESSTVGGQIFLSAASYDKIRDLAEVTGPVPVQVKGVSEPLLLYELRAIGGRFACRLPEMSTDTGPQAAVTLPIVCHVIDGKVVRAESVAGTVVRLGLRYLDARVEAALAPLTNLKLRLNYPGLGLDSADLYGKVVPWDDPAAGGLTRIRLTSVEAADQKVIETIVADAH